MIGTKEIGIHYATDMMDDDIRHRTLHAPNHNQEVVVGAVNVVRDAVRRFYGNRDEQGLMGGVRTGFCGVYLIGSFADEGVRRGWGREASDVDLLMVDRMDFVHSRYSHRGRPLNGNHIAVGVSELLVSEGFGLQVPVELPTEYNIGHVAAKWLLRATPKVKGELPMDFNMVNLNDRREAPATNSLADWLANKDVDADHKPLARVPLLEVEIVAQ